MDVSLLHKTLGYAIANKTFSCPPVERNRKTTEHMRKPWVMSKSLWGLCGLGKTIIYVWIAHHSFVDRHHTHLHTAEAVLASSSLLSSNHYHPSVCTPRLCHLLLLCSPLPCQILSFLSQPPALHWLTTEVAQSSGQEVRGKYGTDAQCWAS